MIHYFGAFSIVIFIIFVALGYLRLFLRKDGLCFSLLLRYVTKSLESYFQTAVECQVSNMVSSYYIQGFVQFYFSSAISYILQLSSGITFLLLSNLIKTAVILEYAFLLPFIGF
jgi:hypothetical protein